MNASSDHIQYNPSHRHTRTCTIQANTQIAEQLADDFQDSPQWHVHKLIEP